MKKIIATSILVAAAAPAFSAPNWIVVKDSESYIIYLEKNSVRTTGKITKAWFRQNHKKPTPILDANGEKKYVGSHLELDSFDCESQKMRIESMYTYSESNNLGSIVIDLPDVGVEHPKFIPTMPGWDIYTKMVVACDIALTAKTK